MTSQHIAVIPGDGIGIEVVNEGVKILEKLEEIDSVHFSFDTFPWGCQYYLKNHEMMPYSGLETLKEYDSIIMGAVGHPSVPDHISLWGLLLPIRREFDQYVNLRPVKLLRGIRSPLAGKRPGSFDFVVIRENTEGEYSNMGGVLREGTPDEVAVQNSIFTRKGTERIIRYAFELSLKRSQDSGKEPYVVGATKSNGINYTMPFWDRIFKIVASSYSSVKTNLYLIDALSAYFISKPESFDVVVASNLFGDILTDIGGAISGGIGVAPSANLNPEGKFPSLFEPVHGSAPDIAGKGIANPVGMLWTISMFLDHIKMEKASKKLLEAVQNVMEQGTKTPDLGGRSSTSEVSDAVITELVRIY
jgi:tartrate dehydrogenase/decarboxylase/D-malate dehydrogenase